MPLRCFQKSLPFKQIREKLWFGGRETLVLGEEVYLKALLKSFFSTHQLHQQIHPLLDRPVAMCPPCSWHQVVSVGQVCLLFSLKKCTLQIQKGMIFHLISRESCSLLFHGFQFWTGKEILVFVDEDGLFSERFFE